MMNTIPSLLLLALLSLSSTASGPTFLRLGSQDPHITIQLALDLTCPDSKMAFNNLQPVLAQFNQTLALHIVLFPLPYHSAAFQASAGFHQLLLERGQETALLYLETLFRQQSSLTNYQVRDLSPAELRERIEKLVEGVGIHFQISGSSSGTSLAIHSWKYAAARSVNETPTYFVDDNKHSNMQYWTMSQWEELLQERV